MALVARALTRRVRSSRRSDRGGGAQKQENGRPKQWPQGPYAYAYTMTANRRGAPPTTEDDFGFVAIALAERLKERIPQAAPDPRA